MKTVKNYSNYIYNINTYILYTRGIQDAKELAWLRYSLVNLTRRDTMDTTLEEYATFNELWSLLKTDDERDAFTTSCSYTRENGKLIIYFHCYDSKDHSWHDYNLRSFRIIMKHRPQDLEIYDTVGY